MGVPKSLIQMTSAPLLDVDTYPDSMTKRVAILYICTGKYDVFWSGFHESAEQHFCNGLQKHYFVFTDSKNIASSGHVTVIPQDNLGWPVIACDRYRILLRIRNVLAEFDAMAFFNANALFVKDVSYEEFFGSDNASLVAVLHPLFPKEKAREAPFESRSGSTAYVHPDNRQHYCQSAISAGRREPYLRMLEELAANTEIDMDEGIVALWHDESHWNAYINNHRQVSESLHLLSQSYMYPESYEFPYEKKIMMRDKHKQGGHAYLRGQSGEQIPRSLLPRILNRLRKSF
jgi:hypothetical protein